MKYPRRSGWTLIASAGLASAALVGAFFWRSSVNTQIQTAGCVKIHILDVALESILIESVPTDASLKRIAYYRLHPAERAVTIKNSRIALRKRLKLLRAADCGR